MQWHSACHRFDPSSLVSTTNSVTLKNCQRTYLHPHFQPCVLLMVPRTTCDMLWYFLLPCLLIWSTINATSGDWPRSNIQLYLLVAWWEILILLGKSFGNSRKLFHFFSQTRREWDRYISYCRHRPGLASTSIKIRFHGDTWVFPKIGVPQNGWFIMENPIIKWMIWGYTYFWKHPLIEVRRAWLIRSF